MLGVAYMYYLVLLFQALGGVTHNCCVIKSDRLFFIPLIYLISQQYWTRLLTWIWHMPSYLKHSSSLASVTHCSLIFPPTLAALSWHPT